MENTIDLKDVATGMKSTINALLNRNKFIDFIRKLIDESDVIDFQSSITRKFINKYRPVFELRMDIPKAYEKYNISSDDTLSVEGESLVLSINQRRGDVVRNEIINPLNNMMASLLHYVIHREWNTEDETIQQEILNLLEGEDLDELKMRVNQIFVMNELDPEDIFIYGTIYSVSFGELPDVVVNNDEFELRIIL